jgi:hypothetical protein
LLNQVEWADERVSEWVDEWLSSWILTKK